MANPSEVAAYRNAGQEFLKKHPDHEQVLFAASERGLDLSVDAVDEIVKLRAHALVYDLARPESQATALSLHGMAGERVRERIRFLHKQLEAQGTYSEPVFAKESQSNADAYIRQRRAEKRR